MWERTAVQALSDVSKTAAYSTALSDARVGSVRSREIASLKSIHKGTHIITELNSNNGDGKIDVDGDDEDKAFRLPEYNFQYNST